MNEVCGDNRFEIIEHAKKRLIEDTNIESRQEEIAVLDSIMFRMWQMGWLPGQERTCDDLGNDSFVCSKCGFDCYVNSKQYGLCIPDYCPNCGAKVVE